VAIGKGRGGAVFGDLRTIFLVGAAGELTDGQLLERFATGPGEAAGPAFAALVERHGPMVLRVCRGVLADPHDADDAFQAVFLVLVARARSLWVRDSLGPWLHQVAFRTASGARASAARRRRFERSAAATREASRAEGDGEVGRILHEEVDRLPDRYRAPVVLCDLGGRTHEQAARHLGWPVGTVKSRLARARDRLRGRLLRRGLAPGAGLLVAASADAITPSALAASATGAAVRHAAAGMSGRGRAVTLARETLRTMSMTRWFKIASTALALGATASAVGPLARPVDEPRPEAAARADDVPVVAVMPGDFKHTLVERGVVQPSRVSKGVSEVRGQTAIISIMPDGAKVRKGDRVCVLDSAPIKDQLQNQRIAEGVAEAAHRDAVLAREAAEIAVHEYADGTSRVERDALDAAIASAQASGRRAQARVDRTRRARAKMDDAPALKGRAPTPAEILADLDFDDRLDAAERDLDRETAARALAVDRRGVFETYTRPRTIKGLTVDLGRKRADESVAHSARSLAKDKAEWLVRQIESCTMIAPADGILVDAYDPPRPAGAKIMRKGVSVGERETIFRILNLDAPLLVHTKVREAWVDRVAQGVRAGIKVDALPGKAMTGRVVFVAPRADDAGGIVPNVSTPVTGRVVFVAPRADPTGMVRNEVKLYTIVIEVEASPPTLTPGMTAEVEIPIFELAGVLTVPVSAVRPLDGKDYLTVKTADGRLDRREVSLGLSDDKRVEVKRGIQAGDLVVLNPPTPTTGEPGRAQPGDRGRPAAGTDPPR